MGNKYGDIRWKWLAEKGFNVLSDKHQYAYMQSLWSPVDIVHGCFCNSPAGTGKTTLAVLAGIYEVEKGTYDKLIYIRNTVAVRDQGFLPGTTEAKESPFMQPLIDAMDYVHPSLFEKWSNGEEGIPKVYAMSSSYSRGVTFKNAYVVIDESQNFDLHELQTLLTRVDSTCKVVVIGSTLQVDNTKLKRYGGLTPFEVYMKHFEGFNVTYHKLETNYRGAFSLLADQVLDTVNRLQEVK
ncbi:PhoH family protein [Niallia circulans]|uniref:PhoH family protein n=1 Tax=Niallia circulans TaxID=1397 RepID=UPI0026F3252F|nr:PhoH family protein [Niallia circulans]